MNNSRRLFLYIVIFLISTLVALAIVELILRTVSFTSGANAGSAGVRWSEKNWKPINKLGYRDIEVDIDKSKAQIIVFGDSFTSGHGVGYGDTYFSVAKQLGQEVHQYINIGENGTSNIKQEQNYHQLVDQYRPNVYAAVHQYFGNDIQDYVTIPEYVRSELRLRLTKLSELANFVDTILFTRGWGEQYVSSIFAGYRDPTTLNKHLEDLKRFHTYIRASGAKVIFVVFPFLNDNKLIEDSETYIASLKKYFMETCRAGDVMFDVSPMARQMSVTDRVVNVLDAHPSVALHLKVGQTVDSIIRGKYFESPGVFPCSK